MGEFDCEDVDGRDNVITTRCVIGSRHFNTTQKVKMREEMSAWDTKD